MQELEEDVFVVTIFFFFGNFLGHAERYTRKQVDKMASLWVILAGIF
jgi:hypothetical protein